jgi:hypothetical protein
MSRSREARQQKKEDFLDANPQLARYTTHVEVGRDDLPPYVAVATFQGEPTFAFTDILAATPDQTLAFSTFFPGGLLSAGGFLEPSDGDEVSTLDIAPFMDLLSLGENGFGVAQDGFYAPVPYVIGAEMLPMEPTMGNNAALRR